MLTVAAENLTKINIQVAASFGRSSLDDSPLILALIFFVIGSAMAIFGVHAVRTRTTWDKWGNEIRGGWAVVYGYAMCVASVVCGFVSLGMFISGIAPYFDSRNGYGSSWSSSSPEVVMSNKTAPGNRDRFDDFANSPPATSNRPRRDYVAPAVTEPDEGSDSEEKDSPVVIQPGRPRENEFVRNSIGNRNFGGFPSANVGRPSISDVEDKTAEMRNRQRKDAADVFGDDSSDVFVGNADSHAGRFEDESEESFAAGEALDLGASSVSLPAMKFAFSDAKKSNLLGVETQGKDFASHGPENSLLVGMRIGVASDQVQSIQPIYQLEEKYHYGELVGNARVATKLVLAKPGYVVSAISVSSSPHPKSIQLKFMKLDPQTGELEVFDQYQSQRIGLSTSAAKELDAKGWHVVGLFGRVDEKGIAGLGLAAVKASIDSDAVPSSQAIAFRTWYSKDRKFSVEAKFQEMNGLKAVLLKRDGSKIEVPKGNLCDEDRAWIDAN